MDLRTWIEQNFPRPAEPREDGGEMRGARRWFVRLSGTSHETLNRVLDGEPLRSLRAATRISDATGGAVSVAALMGFADAKSTRKSA
jgi:hypothetical protein